MRNCPICKAACLQVAQLPEGTLWRCPWCQWLSTQDVPVKPILKSNPEKEKKDEYLAIVHKTSFYVDLQPDDKVLDVQCGDGTLLGWYNKRIRTLGVESNPELMKQALNSHRADLVVDNLNAAALTPGAKFKIITVIDVFQDYVPLLVLTELKSLLHVEGAIVIQVPYFPGMQAKDFPLCQNYFLTYTFNTAVEKCNLAVQGAEYVKGNIRVYITHPGFKKFASSDYNEKLRLYTALNSAIITELHARYDTEVPYTRLEKMLRPQASETRNEIHV